jgi:dolichyl-phosphate beta-glucosyltransferase
VLEFSVVIPAYNEISRLPQFLNELKVSFANQSNYEVIIVDDGSTDDTAKFVVKLSYSWPELKLISLTNNFGKGYAVATGVYAAHGELTLFADADGAYGATEILSMRDNLTEDYDIAIGKRDRKANQTNVSIRLWLGICFNYLIRSLALLPFSDTQSGIKIFRTKKIRPIFAKLSCDRFAFDIELLLLAKKAGLNVREVPINCQIKSGSKVKLVQSSAEMISDVLKLYLKNR